MEWVITAPAEVGEGPVVWGSMVLAAAVEEVSEEKAAGVVVLPLASCFITSTGLPWIVG